MAMLRQLRSCKPVFCVDYSGTAWRFAARAGHLVPLNEHFKGGPQPPSACHFVTRNLVLLLRVVVAVTTLTAPEVAPAGTVVSISESATTENVAAVPLKLTLAAPVKLVPRMMTVAPTFPEGGFVFTNGCKPADRLKTVPPPVPATAVVP